jgi:acyl dehydratase
MNTATNSSAGSDFGSVRVGDSLPPLESGVITRHRIALYAHGSGDINPIHVDSDFACSKAGLPDVIVHGMFSMGYLSRVVTEWAGPNSVRSIENRFQAMLPVMESLSCTGTVTAVEQASGGALVTIQLVAEGSNGATISSATAVAFVQSR